jgi:predicted MPP superfamily phosphohydrolase
MVARACAAPAWARGHRRGVLLSAFAVWQGVRAPVVVEYEVAMKDLPAALDGTVLVMVTDLHLGAQRRAGWMEERVAQINALQPPRPC